MKNNEEIYPSSRNIFTFQFWFLFVTTLVLSGTSFAQPARQDQESLYDPSIQRTNPIENESNNDYDSSIQRSNFLSEDPHYEKAIKDQIKDRRSQFLWKLRMDGQSLETASNIQSQIAGATFGLKFRYRLIEDLDFLTLGNISAETGRSQDIFGDQEPGTGLYPRDVKLQYKPLDGLFRFEAGLISQGKFNEPLFVSSLPFIGLSEEFNYRVSSFEFGLGAQQLIPTSYTQSNRVGEREEMPQFQTQTVKAKWNISDYNFIQGSVTHFSYDDLPAVVAFNSFIYGNTVTNTDINNAEFIYGFDGFLNRLTFEQKLTNSLSAQVQWHTIKNNEAPSDAGEAQALNFWLANDFGRWIVAGHYKDYFIETDAVPSFYNSHRLGHNNRIGQTYRIDLESKDWGVIFRASYTEADLLQTATRRIDGLQQDDQRTIYLSVETLYDFI